MSRRGLFWQLFVLYTLLALAALGAVTLRARSALRELAERQTIHHLEAEARLAAEGLIEPLQQGDFHTVQLVVRRLGAKGGLRITVVLPSGRVVADSQEDPARMDNHAGRPEIAAAWRDHRPCHAIRFSNTVKEELVYVALPLVRQDGQGGAPEPLAVVRTAQPMEALSAAAAQLEGRILGMAILAVLGIGGLSAWMARRLSRSLRRMAQAAEQFAAGRFEHDLELAANGPRELNSLALALQDMAAELKRRLAEILREQERRQAMWAAMSEGVLALDAEGQIVEINQSAAAMFGVQAAEVVGRPLHEVVRIAALLELVDRVVATRQAGSEEIVLYGQPRRHLMVRANVIEEPEGQPPGTLLVLVDLTRLKQLETVRRDFVAAAGHELRTPLTSIKGYAETLLDGALDNRQDAERFVRTILQETNRLMALMADIFALARVENEAEKGLLETTVQPLRPVLEDALAACRQAAAEKRIGLELEAPAELSACVNSSLLQQAVVNLVDNAIKYSPPDTVVRIVTHREQDRIAIRVIDQGCGIEAHHLPRLFERFYRADKARSRELGGTGLGLAIVKHIVLAHGGSVEVASRPGQGSTFTILLPAPSLDDSLPADRQ